MYFIFACCRSVQLEHSGDIICKLKNHLGEATCRAKLKVHEDLAKKGECPLFVERPSDLEVMEGGEARFECVVNGTPDPEVLWYFNGRELFVSAYLVCLISYTRTIYYYYMRAGL